MTSIVRYQKAIADGTTYRIALPLNEEGQHLGTELATLDGVTYVAIPDDHELPEQPEQITVEPVTLTDELRAAIKSVSPHVRLINARVIEKIRAVYSVDDEIKCLRLAPSDETDAWNAHVEACRAWGTEEKAALGL
jgi:hypothetical protein